MAFDRQIAALTIYCEASGEIPAVRRAIAHVILNRVHDGRWGKTVAAVCLKRMQFSEWNADAADNRNLERAAEAAEDDPIMLDSAVAYDEAAHGLTADPTLGATHFYATSINPPAWTELATCTGAIGSVRFFKNVA